MKTVIFVLCLLVAIPAVATPPRVTVTLLWDNYDWIGALGEDHPGTFRLERSTDLYQNKWISVTWGLGATITMFTDTMATPNVCWRLTAEVPPGYTQKASSAPSESVCFYAINPPLGLRPSQP